jgi:hypothetical protein
LRDGPGSTRGRTFIVRRSTIPLGFAVPDLRPGHALLVPCLVFALGGCGGASSTGPAEPGAGQDLRLVSAVPGDGATLVVRDCPNPFSVPLCTFDLVLTVEARYDRPLAVASAYVEFYTSDGRRCAAGNSPEAALPVNSGRAFQISTTYLSFPPNQPLLCPLPVTTSRVVLLLVDTSGPPVRILRRELAGTYTFQMAGAASHHRQQGD